MKQLEISLVSGRDDSYHLADAPSTTSFRSSDRKTVRLGPRTLFFGAILFLVLLWIFVPRSYSRKDGTPHDRPQDRLQDRPLIMYSYFETENARLNAEFFIRHGIHDGADFKFVLNGETNLETLLPQVPYVTYVKRPNTCFDLGSHGEVLTNNDAKLLNSYKRFILMNASVRGPFLPTWSNQCWSDAYLDQLNEHTKLVGMTYNCYLGQPFKEKRKKHVSSMVLAFDEISMKLAINEGGLTNCYATKEETIFVETGLTGLVERAGYKVTALMTAFHSRPDYEKVCKHDDLNWDNKYFGFNLHPYEMMFIKANRNIDPKMMEHMTAWTDGMKYDSQNFCGSGKRSR